jgi:hypothetical protein
MSKLAKNAKPTTKCFNNLKSLHDLAKALIAEDTSTQITEPISS